MRGVRYEWARLLSGFKVAAMIMLPALLAWLSIGVLHQNAVADAGKVGEEVFSATQMTAFDGVGKGLKVGLPILMVLMAGLASQSIAGEQSKGTLRYLLLRPMTRMQLLWSKFTALSLVCLAGYALLMMASVSASSYFFDFTDLAEILPNGKLFPLVKKADMLHYLWPALYSPVLALMAYTAIGFSLGSWIRNNVAALTGTLGTILLLDLGRAVIPVRETIGWLPSAHLPSPFGGHSFLRFYSDMVQGVSNATNPYADRAILTPLIWLICAMVLASISIKRKAG